MKSELATLKSGSILIADDSPVNLTLLETILRRFGYEVAPAASGAAVFEKLQCFQPDLILLDIVMPEMDGLEVCRRVKQKPRLQSTPVIFITAQDDAALLKQGFAAGAVDYVTKPFSTEELIIRINTHIEMSRLRNNLEAEVAQRTADLSDALGRLENANREILNRLTLAAEHRDNETANHLKRMSRYSVAIGRVAQMDEYALRQLALASPMHDVGKIGIPDSILLKPGRLTPDEFAIMKTHPQKGADLLAGLDSQLTEMARAIALTHHEKFDGSGYPNGLRGNDIPLTGRIVAIADVFDALTSVRPYKKAWTISETVTYIEQESGAHFDPDLVACFRQCLPEILEIHNELHD